MRGTTLVQGKRVYIPSRTNRFHVVCTTSSRSTCQVIVSLYERLGCKGRRGGVLLRILSPVCHNIYNISRLGGSLRRVVRKRGIPSKVGFFPNSGIVRAEGSCRGKVCGNSIKAI